MADVLRIKRRVSGAPGAPTSLANAELAYNEVDHILYYGEGTGGAGGTASVIVGVGGNGLASSTNPLMNGAVAPGTGTTWSRTDHVHPIDTSRAPLASPAFSGIPTAPTAAPGTGTIQLATCAFANAAAAAAGVQTFNTRSGVVTLLLTDITGAGGAPLASPAFTGVPTTASTPANGDNTTKLATTAFVLATRHDQLVAPNADVSWNNRKITGLADPTLPQDAATKNYVDGAVQGLATKDSVRAATTGNITLSAVQVVDGVTLVVGDRVLVKNQTTPAQNGIYIVAAGAWTRSLDADIWNELVSAYVFVEEGTTNAGNGYQCTVAAGGTLGTTPITWVQFSGAGQITAGGGLTKSGNQIDAVGTAARILVNADSIDIDAAYVGQTSLITLGSVTTGTWNATTIAVNRGGTGATTLTGYLIGNGVGAFTASSTIPNTAITGLGTMSTQNATAVAITGGTIDNITFDCGTF